METWQEKMRKLSRESMFYASLSGARGGCAYEGDEYNPAVIERNLLDALYVARNPLGNSPAEVALRDRARNSKDIKELRMTIGRDTSELQSLMRISYAVFC